ncbi:MAG: hypothetical protein L6416_04560 [Candidatus Omnitrophica bacterium]|nr:hypothetical protein [Candidatus Omnitrophota bacterium]
MIIRCTAKLLKEMGITKNDLVEKTSSESALDEWYAHLFFLARRKCVLFAHAKTYYGFVAYDVKREDIRKLDEVFRKNFGYRLYEDGFSPEAIKKANTVSDTVVYSRTIDRHVLSTMNQMIYEFGACLDRHGFITSQTLKKSSDFLPRTPHKQGRDYIIPLEEMWPLLEEKYPVTKAEAQEIAQTYQNVRKRRIFAITGQLPQRLQSQSLSLEPCWYVFYQWSDEQYHSNTGKTMCISRANGAVLYDDGL